ncbi:hypothetical protein HNP72_001104 [Sphingobacterium soli]|nr:hypothetical protein [Sphingobacterium soli]
MIEYLLISLMIGITGVFMTNYNPPYISLLEKIKLNKPPMNCTKCFSWWLGILFTIILYTHPIMILIAPCSALLAIVIERLVKSLPMIF